MTLTVVAVAEAGFRVLAIDFRGYGKSRGPGQSDIFAAPLYVDALAAVHYLFIVARDDAGPRLRRIRAQYLKAPDRKSSSFSMAPRTRSSCSKPTKEIA